MNVIHQFKTLRKFALILVILLAFALRVWNLDSQELRGDEAFGYFFSQQSFQDIVEQTLNLREPHPVAGYFVQATWQKMGIPSEFWVRFPAAWFGTLAVALTTLLAQTVTRWSPVVVVATWLTAVSPYAVWHSQDARMYSMSLALTAATSALLAMWWLRRHWVAMVGYVLFSWVALHTHYFAGFILLAHTVFMLGAALMGRVSWSSFWLFGRAQMIVLTAYLPWLVAARNLLLAYGGNGDSPTLPVAVVRSISAFVVGMSPAPLGNFGWFAIGAAAFLIGGTLLWQRAEPEKGTVVWLLPLCGILPLLLTWYGARQRPIFDERYLLAAAIPFYVVAAGAFSFQRVQIWKDGAAKNSGHSAGAAFHVGQGAAEAQPTIIEANRAPNQVLRLLGLVMVVAVSFGMVGGLWRYATDQVASKTRGWRELAASVDKLLGDLPPHATRIAQNYPDPTLWFYYRGEVEHIVLPPAAADEAGALESVHRLGEQNVQRVVLPVQPDARWDPETIAGRTLATTFQMVYASHIGVWNVEVYARPPQEMQQGEWRFGNGALLTQHAHSPPIASAGDLVVIHLAWNLAVDTANVTDKIFVHLLDADGTLVAQNDQVLASQVGLGESGVAGYGILIPEHVAIGEYNLVSGLYDPTTTESPRYLLANGQDHVNLGTVTIRK